MAKVTHYIVDSRTWPHLHRGKPWSHYHVLFESKVGRWLVEYRYELEHFEFRVYPHIYRSCRAESCGAREVGLEVVKRLEDGEKLTDKDCLMASRRCIQGIGDIWLTLAKQMGIVA